MATPIKRYAVVGTGGRSTAFIDPITTRFREHNELVGLCDVNPARMDYHNDRLVEKNGYHKVPTFLADDFDRMIRETKPDAVIVSTIDAMHDKYIIRAMELGCDVVSEKPMTIDGPRCRAIYDAIKRTGKRCRVGFNMRWRTGCTLVKQLVSEGRIGQVLHADMEYFLNTHHGADYFHRWHREKDKSGGLILHKSTHHLDFCNWVIDAVPQTVVAMGRLAFYGRENAEKRGLKVAYDRYAGHDTTGDPFAIDIQADERMRKMYYEAEKYDGYVRDRNVFGDGITSEDTMAVLVRYRTGTVLNYSVTFYQPCEGYRLVLNGSKGRLEFSYNYGSHIPGQKTGEGEVLGGKCIVQEMFKKAEEVPVPEVKGGHGGADALLTEQIFSPNPPEEKFGRNAGHGQGAASLLIGAAANRSLATGNQPIQIHDLCPELGDATHLSELPE